MSYHTRDDWDAAVEHFNGNVVMAYQNGDQYGTDKMMFAAKSGAETWNYPVMQPSVAVNEADGDNVVTTGGAFQGNEGDIVTPKLEVDSPLKDIRILPLDQIDVRPELSLPSNYSSMLGRSVAEGKGIRLTGPLANSALGLLSGGGEQTVGVDFQSTTLGNDLKDAFDLVGANMDEAGIPSEGRHCMLRSTYWYSLMGIAGIFTKEYGGQANVRAPGSYIDYANFKIHNGRVGFGQDYTASPWDARMPTKYQCDTTLVGAVIWHEESWALRHWKEPTTMNDWVALHNGYKIETRLVMGAIDIQPEGIWAFEDNTAVGPL